MANPQKEEGFTAIANEIMEALCHIRIPGEERQVLDCILRKTYGWNKCEDAIALSQFMEMTGLNKPAVCRAIQGLLSKKIIAIIKKDNEPAKLYKFIKDYHQWQPLSKKITLSKKIISVIKKDNLPLSKKSTTKDTTTKETITKDKVKDFCLSNLIKKETWEAYLEMRKTIKKPATLHAQNLIIKKLLKMEDDPNLILEQSIENSYQGVFPLKTGGTSGTNTNRGNRNQKVYSEQDRIADEINAEYYRRKAAEASDNPTGNT